MQTMHRRAVFLAIMTGATVFVGMRSARSQSTFFKLPYNAILGAIASCISIYNFINEKFGQPSLCRVNYSDLYNAKDITEDLRVALSSIDDEPVVSGGHEGLIPALMSFTQNPSAVTWRRVRRSLIIFLNAEQKFLINMQIIFSEYPEIAQSEWKDQQDQILAVLKSMEDFISTSHFDKDQTTGFYVEGAVSVEQRIAVLPEKLENLSVIIELDVENRSKCSH